MSKSDRDQRLAAKLRENLKRRKMQARARKSADPSVTEDKRDTDNAPDARPGSEDRT